LMCLKLRLISIFHAQ
jgi:hypothetical protein